jgi:hypothetical protein
MQVSELAAEQFASARLIMTLILAGNVELEYVIDAHDTQPRPASRYS